MRTAPLMLALLVAAALAGCTGGTSSDEGQNPDEESRTGTPTGSQTTTTTRPPGDDRGRRTQGNQTYEAHLEVFPDNGTAPLNVTLEFDVTWSDSGRHTGQQGNGTGSSNRTSTGEPGQHALNRGHAKNMTWTLEVRYNATASSNMTNATEGNGTAGGNATGNTTSGSSTQTTTGSAGNGTGNQTGGGQTGNATAHGTVIASFNGTGGELPSNRTVTLNTTGSYEAVFTVYLDDGSDLVRRHSIAVSELPPGTPLGNETRTFEGSFLASEPLLCFGSDEHEWILNGTFAGRAAEVSHVNVTVESAGFADVELTLVAPNGTEVASGAEIHEEGPFAAGNYTLTAESCVAADAEYTVTAIAHYVTRAA